MPLRRREIELSVERTLGRGGDPSAGVARLSARFEVSGDGPTPEELQEALDRLRAEIGRLSVIADQPDRPLEELIETYHPRQAELLDLLREEGEISSTEFDRLRAHLGAPPSTTTSASPPVRPSAPPAARAPAADRPPSTGRSVAELLREYRIESLRQAGLVRARREISFDEYMALKRHFEEGTAPAVADG